jgi:hypothetical protein
MLPLNRLFVAFKDAVFQLQQFVAQIGIGFRHVPEPMPV